LRLNSIRGFSALHFVQSFIGVSEVNGEGHIRSASRATCVVIAEDGDTYNRGDVRLMEAVGAVLLGAVL